MACDIATLMTGATGAKFQGLDELNIWRCCAGLLSSNLGNVSANTALSLGKTFQSIQDGHLDDIIAAILCSLIGSPSFPLSPPTSAQWTPTGFNGSYFADINPPPPPSANCWQGRSSITGMSVWTNSTVTGIANSISQNVAAGTYDVQVRWHDCTAPLSDWSPSQTVIVT